VSNLCRVFVVTFRRPHLLRRALQSLLNQTDPRWVAEVLNDDPGDHRVAELIADLSDTRITLANPCIRRGGTANFNYAFQECMEPFAAILEDDNWWEPAFVDSMTCALNDNPTASVAVANERIWREQADGGWKDTGNTVWPASQEISLLPFRVADKCGGAKLCNSSMLWRTRQAGAWITPASIPIDVTEHFRERVVPHPILLIHSPLVNYAETLITHRKTHGSEWGTYQCLLIGSVFALLKPTERKELADFLWARARTADPVLKTTLSYAGIAVSEARTLWEGARLSEKLRFGLTIGRRPYTTVQILLAKTRKREAWRFLMKGAFADYIKQRPLQMCDVEVPCTQEP
jgi:glycosyltransferase involved in cell wall biosynthesis